jgi:hypothetical protein
MQCRVVTELSQRRGPRTWPSSTSSTSSHASAAARAAASRESPGCAGRGEASGLRRAAAAGGAARRVPSSLAHSNNTGAVVQRNSVVPVPAVAYGLGG